MVFPATMVCPPEIDVLIKAHHDGQSDLTVMLNPYCRDNMDASEASGIYVCNPDVLKHIPKAGYFDIKEGLIPKILHAGRTVYAATLPYHAGNFRNRQEYLYALSSYFENVPKLNANLKPLKNSTSRDVWVAENVMIDPEARINGSVVIMDVQQYREAIVLGRPFLGKMLLLLNGICNKWYYGMTLSRIEL
jgi:hypothetical protein